MCALNASSVPPDGQRRRCGLTLVEFLVVAAILALLVALLLPATRRGREPARRTQCRNNLKQIGLALHNYHDVYGSFPPAYVLDDEGNRLHSWRTLLLPFLDQEALYQQIDLSKPWNDPANADIAAQPNSAFHCPSASGDRTLTNYLAVIGDSTCFQPTSGRAQSEITDEHGHTLMIVEVPVDEAVPWMQPHDLDEQVLFRWTSAAKFPHSRGYSTLLVDGSIDHLTTETPAHELRALVSIHGND